MFEGEYLNDLINGKGKEFFVDYLTFEEEYVNYLNFYKQEYFVGQLVF